MLIRFSGMAEPFEPAGGDFEATMMGNGGGGPGMEGGCRKHVPTLVLCEQVADTHKAAVKRDTGRKSVLSRRRGVAASIVVKTGSCPAPVADGES